MSYRKGASDEGLSFEDANLVYVSDRHGVLTSPPGYEKSAKKFVRECDVVHGASCVRQLADNQQSPRSLFQICKNFVAKNLHLVESLDNFPETIGHELFLEALQVESFHKNPAFLEIFCEAYKELVLKDLCLKEETILINEYLPYFLCFNNLVKLDLSHCRLGNNHEYFKFIGKMRSLECLYLKDNCLTDSGLATWSLPYRMFNNGPEFLKILDLSCNPDLTCFCLKSLFKFSHLKSLNLSGTGVTMSPGIARFKTMMSFSLVSYIQEFNEEMSTLTRGWATPFISELSSKLNAQRNDKKLEWKRRTLNNFYQRHDTSAVMASKNINTNNYPVVLLQSVEDVLPGTLRTLHVENQCTQGIVTGDKCTALKCQKECKTHIKDEGLDELRKTKLLNSYLKYL